MKSNYCTDCLIQTDCEYIKVDIICKEAAAFEAGRRDKEKELPKNAVIIDGTIHSFVYNVTEGDICDHCDLNSKCGGLFGGPMCSIFGLDAYADGCFKKEAGL